MTVVWNREAEPLESKTLGELLYVAVMELRGMNTRGASGAKALSEEWSGVVQTYLRG